MIVPPTPLGSSTKAVSDVAWLASLTVANKAAGVAGINSAPPSSTRVPPDEFSNDRAAIVPPIGNRHADATPQASAANILLRCREGIAVMNE